MPIKTPLINIGFMKSGSSFIETNLLTQKYNFNNPFAYDLYHEQLIQRLFCVNPFEFDIEGTREFFIQKWLQSPQQNHIPVLTLEDISGNPLAAVNHEREMSYRLKELFPQAKILITIREQRSIILSAWCHYLRKNGPQPISRFVGKQNLKPGVMPICRIFRYRYDSMMTHYFKLFGRENVCVLPAEILFKDQQAFAGKVFDFAGSGYEGEFSEAVAVNPAFPPIELVVRHVVGKFYHRDVLGERGQLFNRGVGRLCRLITKITPQCVNQHIKQKWHAYIEEFTEGYFDNSNARLEKLLDMDLKQYGYRCG